MPTITTSSSTTALQWPAGTKMDRDKRNGHLWVQLTNSSGAFEFWRSTDNGSTWTLRTTITRASVEETGSIYIDSQGHLHWTFRTNQSSQDRVYYRRLKIDTLAWGSELLVTDVSNGGTAGSGFYSGGDVIAIHAGSYIYVAIAIGERSGTQYHGAKLNGVVVNRSTLAQSVNNGIFKGTRRWLHDRTGESLTSLASFIRPSLDFEHYGDGTSSDVAHLWMGFGCDVLRCVKLSWGGGYWTGPSGTALVSSGPFNLGGKSTAARWEGSRFVLAVPWAGDLERVKVYQRNASNTGGQTPEIITPAHPAGVVRHCTFSFYSAPSNDIYRVYAVGTSSDLLYFTEYDRNADTWTTWATVSASAVQGVTNFGARRNIHGNLLFSVYMSSGTTPFTLSHLSGTFPSPPNAPTWNAASGNSGEARNVSAALLLDWDFNDPDSSDTQSAYALSRQIGAGTVNYFRASDSTWQTTEQKNTSATTSRSLASGWGADGDAVHTYKVKTWDAADLAGPYGEGFTVIPSAVVNPTMNAPTEGQAISGPRLVVTWTVTEESSYRVVLKPNPNPNLITTYDSGWVFNPLATSHEIPLDLPDASAWTVTLETRNNEGLGSAVQTRNFTVDFIEPNAPTKTVTAISASGVIRVVITNPSSTVSHVGTGAAASANWAQIIPALPSGLQVGDLMLLLATTRNTTAGAVNVPTGWTSLAVGQNVRLMGRVYQAGDGAPTVTFSGGAAGDDCIGQIAAFRNAVLAASASAFLLNASQQNVTYPSLTIPKDGQLILLGGMKQDDWTSVDTLTFFTEIGEPVSIAGTDAGLVWDFVVQGTASNIGQADFTVTGGVAAAGRGMAVAIDTRPSATDNDVYRRVTGTTDEVRVAAGVATGGTWDDYTAVSGVDYEYKVRAWGANGTFTDSTWT